MVRICLVCLRVKRWFGCRVLGMRFEVSFVFYLMGKVLNFFVFVVVFLFFTGYFVCFIGLSGGFIGWCL